LRARIIGRDVEIELTPSARRAIGDRSSPLLAEMELYFSCLIRKRVYFRDAVTTTPDDGITVIRNLRVTFRPIMTATCSVSDLADNSPPPVTDFPIMRAESFVPHWLRIDFRGGVWSGEFGYH